MELRIELPNWLDRDQIGNPILESDEDRMRFVIGLSRKTAEAGLGGPFGAAVFEESSGELISLGANLVIDSKLSTAHAEVIALSIAQLRLDGAGTGQGATPGSRYVLYSSTEPCAMCLGAAQWAGVSGIVCGARDEDARRIGFDEGIKHPDWLGEMRAKGIAVRRDVCRSEAAAVLEWYRSTGGVLY